MSSLETQVNLLASLIERLDTVRDVSAGNLPVHLRAAIANVSSLAEELASTQVQNALASAEMEQDIKAVDLQSSRREIRKRKTRIDTAPPAKRPECRKRSCPPRTGINPLEEFQLTQNSLPNFIQQFNQANSETNLSVWTSTNSATGQSSPLRLVIPNVLVAYINLRTQQDPFKLESATVTGVREQRTTSEFAVFRLISQYIFRILAQDGDMSLLDLLSLIASYRDLYTTTCTKCKSIHSSQDNTPTIIRTWTETEDSQWTLQCYHESCAPL